MTDVPNCPICKKPLDGHHAMDCHFPGMSRESALIRLIPSPRLNPEGVGWTCPECGSSESCAKCQATFDAIEYAKPR